MESLEDVFKIIKKDVWMASVDLKDAFFTIPVHILHQKYFKFEWFNQFYKFLGMPNGYSDAMRIFTKMLKPVFGYLRKQGHLSVVFVDDSYLQADTEQECIKNINAIVNILTMLGFTIHDRKSVLILTQKIEFLGFLIDSTPTMQQLSSIIGSVISLFPAIPLGRLHYRALEREKNSLLRKAGGNFDVKINSLKLVSAIFIIFLFFHLMIALQIKNYEKCFLFDLKSSFRSQDIQFFVFLSFLLFLPIGIVLEDD